MATLAVTVVSADVPWMRGLEAGLRTRGFDPLVLPTDDEPLRPRLGPRPLVLLIDANVEPGGATELGAQLRLFLADRCPALVLMGEPRETPDDDVFAGRSARPTDPLELLDELETLIPMVVGMESGFVSRAEARELIDEETG